MAWFNAKNAWGNFPDLAGAVNKLQESVKSIEKNFDTALGFEEKGESSNEGNFYLRFYCLSLSSDSISVSSVKSMIEVAAKSIN